jgi:hypothetical protein
MDRKHQRAMGIAAGVAIVSGLVGTAAAQPAVTDAAAATPGVIAAFITAGATDPKNKVPTLNAIKGAGVSNVTVASPLAILQHGSFYTFVLASQNVTFKGNCTDSYVLERGAKILARGTIHAYPCGPGSYWEWAANSPAIPNSPGIATLVGTVAFGGKKATTSATVLIK